MGKCPKVVVEDVNRRFSDPEKNQDQTIFAVFGRIFECVQW